MRLEIRTFGDSDLTAAAELLAHRHQRDLATEPALPARFTETGVALKAVERAWRKPHTSGVAALQADKMVGYLIGTPEFDTQRGRTVWIPLNGHALEGSQDAELYRDLYAASAPPWLAEGCFAHFALIPANDRAALEAWFALSFGKEQAHAVRETTVIVEPTLQMGANVQIRRVGQDDLEAFMKLTDIVRRYQAGSPVYCPWLPEDTDRRRETFQRALADPETVCWVAEREGQMVGYQLYTPTEQEDDNLLEPEHCTYLNLAATREEARGEGIGQALTAHGLKWAKAHGDTHCGVDWRVTNLSSSRFWPRQGFRPTAYRLYRGVDERVSWGHSRAFLISESR